MGTVQCHVSEWSVLCRKRLQCVCICRYPGTTFMDHVIRYHDDPNVKMLVVLGEVSCL